MTPLYPPKPVCCNWHSEHGGACGAHGYYDDGGWNGYMSPLPPPSYEQLRQVIAKQSFDSKKLAVAKQALMSNWFTSGQVAGIMDLFTFESNKLEFAKLAYSRTVDRQNYYLVNNSFTFKSSSDELEGYIY